jgi:(heptosyl)LPS beta-1,4-glucosyltransferase
MDHALEKSREYAALWAIQRHRLGRRVNLFQCCVHAAWCFFDVLILRSGWLDGRRGFVLAALQSQYTFNKYATLWAMEMDPSPEPVSLHEHSREKPDVSVTGASIAERE